LENFLGFKKADQVILTGCTISQIERKAEMSVTVNRVGLALRR
jgi:hypothetical protein